ncbi:uncharacterized protein TRIADDRAFT_17171, partial [Trichoplax adhaerens]
MWHAFAAIGTEMIITKAGRRLFPTIDIHTSGLDPNGFYSIKVDIAAADDNRYKYVSTTGWVAASNGNRVNHIADQVVFGECEHPNSPNSGKFWMSCETISFKKLKLSNSKEHYKKSDCIVLNSMRRYQPRIVISKWDRDHTAPVDTKIIIFPETRFYAVTCYQNGQITNLKIRYNPFAKAFRD